MKLRIHNQSLRLRLSKDDLETLRESGEICEALSFPGNSELTYALRLNEEIQSLNAQITSGHIQVDIPTSLGEDWLASEELSLKNQQQNLKILVEKDLPCDHMGKES